MIRDRYYAMKLMSTCGKLDVDAGASDAPRHVKHVENGRKVRRRITFKCTEPFMNYCEAWNSIDDHNHRRNLVP